MKLCPYCDRRSENERFCDFCARPIHEVKGENTKKDKEWRDNVKEA
jgi:sarcosine oxidase delta subunit